MNPKRSLVSAILGLFVLLAWAGACQAGVGFQKLSIPAPGGATSIPLAIWYPTDAPGTDQRIALLTQTVATNAPVKGAALKLIVISHGNGGSNDGHLDTALALAEAGFVVAALEHTGDNYRDQSRAADMPNRPRELHRVIDYMLADWPDHAALDQKAVGAFGFSSGGFTVLAAAGGEPDFTLIAPRCAAAPTLYECKVMSDHGAPAAGQTITHDPRIKALVVAAPALGYTFAHGLSAVTQPVQLWRADADKVLPAPGYADAVRQALPRPPEFHTVANADHWDFLTPCSAALAKVAAPICVSRPGFNRVAFHAQFNQAVVAFFQANLR
jgi:predicted dienelactone hydrolase